MVRLPDDIILNTDGNLFVNSLQGTIWRINPLTGQKTALVTGLKTPHGIALDRAGHLIIADAGLNRIFRLVLDSAFLPLFYLATWIFSP